MMNVASIRTHLTPTIFTLAVFSLIWRYGFPKPFEALILLLFFTVAFNSYRNSETRTLIRNLWKDLWVYRNTIAILLVAVFAGSLFSLSTFDIYPHVDEILLEYIRILFSVTLFFLTVYAVNHYRNLAKRTLLVISVSPVVLLSAFHPGAVDFFTDNSRLVGAKNDPNYLATFIGLGIIISLVYFFYTRTRYRWFGFFLMVLGSPLFLWTGSRSAVISLIATYAVLTFVFTVKKVSLNELGSIVLTFVLSLALIFASFFVLSEGSRALIYERTFGTVDDRSFGVGDIYFDRAGFEADSFAHSRSNLWKDGLSMTADAPLGFGPAYHNFNPVGFIGRPHNIWLEVVLTAGWIGFLIWFGPFC